MTLTSCCQLCSTSQSLLRCSACKIIRYCSKNHQVSDWRRHKPACNAISTYSIFLDRLEQGLRNQTDGDTLFAPPVFAPPNVFEEFIGYFWCSLHAEPYTRARYALFEALLKVQSYNAAVAALANMMDCLRLCRRDYMNVRHCVPALLLRLGRDQECYDFVKWWATTRHNSDYDWVDLDAVFDVKNADVLESPEYMC